MSLKKAHFNQHHLIDTTPLPDSIPKVKELAVTSAPLLSASFFIGARCRDYNDDYMQCKTENPGRAEPECMREGRRVTRCARSVIEDINANCLEQFRAHWNCLENKNHQLWQCRPAEWDLNKCAYEKLKLEKVVPNQPQNKTPVHLRVKQIFAHDALPRKARPFVASEAAAKETTASL